MILSEQFRIKNDENGFKRFRKFTSMSINDLKQPGLVITLYTIGKLPLLLEKPSVASLQGNF